MQRGPREREAGYLQFTLQRPSDLIYIPHLLTHAVLILDTVSPTILSGWDSATTTNQQFIIQTLDKYTVGARRGKWCEIFREKVLSALREWVFSPATGAKESKERLEKHWQCWQKHSPNLLNTLFFRWACHQKKFLLMISFDRLG